MKIEMGICKIILFISLVFIILKANTSYALAAEYADTKELKILVIEINPYLKTKGMKATDFLNTFGSDQSLEKSLQEMKDDFDYSSHNIIKTTIVGKEYLNEFPKYTQEFTLSHLDNSTGKRNYTGKGYRLDEETYLDMFGKGWFGWWSSNNPVMSEGIDAYPFKFDYNYLIEKFDLVNRKNKNEFDMVWVFSIDPLSMGETNMVGKNSFWVNGDIIYQDCDNFIICGFTLSRRESAIECIGHLAESMLNYVYDIGDYNSKLKFKNLDELNTWERFYLCKDKAPSSWDEFGVGQIHFSPNSTRDYDWENMNSVKSTWEDWKNNYPYLTSVTSIFNSAVYNDGSMPVNRAHKRWWLSLMPHLKGRDNNGYSHNWWDYITSIDYVEYIESYDSYKEYLLNDYYECILLEKGETLSDLKFRLLYRSGKEEDFIVDNLYNYVVVDNENVIKIENGKVKALNVGISNITLNYDGRSASYKIYVVDDKSSLYFDSIKVNPNSKTLYYDGSANKSMNIVITAPENINYSVTFSSKDNSVAKVSKKGKVTAIGKGTTLITTRIVIGDISKEYKTKVISKKASIDITTSKSILKIGEQFVFKAKTYGLKGNLIWSVSDPKILTINSKTGKVTAKKPGKAYVIVKDGKFTTKIKVMVK